MGQDFVHLHCHSNYSLLEGANKIQALLDAAAEAGMEALAVTDTNALYGAVEFHKAARERGIKPIFGAEVDDPETGRKAVLLARDRKGYSALCRVITARRLDENFSLEDALADERAGLFILSAEPELLRTLMDKRGKEGLRVELSACSPGGMRELARFANENGLPAAVTNDVHFARGEGFRIHKVLAAIRENATIHGVNADKLCSPESWLKPPDFMARIAGEYPEALAETARIAEACSVELELGVNRFPAYPLPPGETPFSYLWKVCFRGLSERYRPITPEAVRRLEMELDTIRKLGYAEYFLVVWDIVEKAKELGIPTVGRGSAANSIVSYVLGATHVDPLEHDLYFERFLNPERVSPPDIDLDFCWRRRDEILEYVYERYGEDRVAMIATINRFSARSAVRDVARAMGMPQSEVTAFTRRLPHVAVSAIEKAVETLPESRDLPLHREPYKTILEIAAAMDRYPRHLGVHTGGMIITPGPLTDYVPLQRAAKGLVVTQCDMYAAEDMGLIKIDLLGQRSLSVIADTLIDIKEKGVEPEMAHHRLISDPDTLRLMRKGKSMGCFYIESPGMRSLMIKLRVEDFPTLVAASSVIRPGPADSGMMRRFIDRHNGREEIVYPHPTMRFLEETHGVMIYQEDVMRVVREVAGMSLSEADSIRRAMSFKGSPEKVLALKKRFMEGAGGKGVEEETAEEIWRQVKSFAGYAFCKAHSASYAQVSFEAAYLKAHHPAEFMAAVLSNGGGFYPAFAYVEEARRMGLAILPSDVNRSERRYIAEGEGIRLGLMSVRDLTRKAVDSLLEARKEGRFVSPTDFCRRVDITLKEAQNLVLCGALDCFEFTRPELMWKLELFWSDNGHGEKSLGRGAGGEPFLKGFPRKGIRGELFLMSALKEKPSAIVPRVPDYSWEKKLALEREILGFEVSVHPMTLYRDALKDEGLISAGDIPKHAGKRVRVAGTMVTNRRVRLKGREEYMKFVTLHDETDIFEATLFPAAYQKYGHLLVTRGPYIITGLVEEDYGYCTITVNPGERGVELIGPDAPPP